jgi:hypothetical protein
VPDRYQRHALLLKICHQFWSSKSDALTGKNSAE